MSPKKRSVRWKIQYSVLTFLVKDISPIIIYYASPPCKCYPQGHRTFVGNGDIFIYMKTTKSLAKLKKELDHYFSQFIRLKHADKDGNEPCYTCGKVKHWKEQQCGHFISRQYLVTRWNEDNCRPQCAGCNLFGNGQLLDFEENLKRELGEEHVELMKKSRHAILKLDRVWYETEIAFYKKRINELV